MERDVALQEAIEGTEVCTKARRRSEEEEGIADEEETKKQKRRTQRSEGERQRALCIRMCVCVMNGMCVCIMCVCIRWDEQSISGRDREGLSG